MGSRLVHIFSRGGKNTLILYATLRQDLQGKVPVTHFGFVSTTQLTQRRLFKVNVYEGGEKNMLELTYCWVETSADLS